MVKKRVITGLLGFLVVVAAIWFDRPLSWLTVLIAVWAVLAASEVFRLTGVSRFPSLRVFGLACTLIFAVSPQLATPFPFLLTALMLLSLVILLVPTHREGSVPAWAWMLAGSLYTGWLMSFFLRLRLDAGKEWVMMALFCTFASDTVAYVVGSAIGRHKLAPRISRKTWEGTFGGLIGSALVAMAMSAFLKTGLFEAIVLGVVVSVMGQTGGLVASLIKRSAGVKDSGSLLPGHGGILDRTDSVLFAGVTAYALFLAYGWLGFIG